MNKVERFLGKLTDKAIRRGVFHSVGDLTETIEAYLQAHNENPGPFVWTTTAEQILEKVRRRRVALDRYQPKTETQHWPGGRVAAAVIWPPAMLCHDSQRRAMSEYSLTMILRSLKEHRRLRPRQLTAARRPTTPLAQRQPYHCSVCVLDIRPARRNR